jgi:hypothetical protein
MLILMVHNASHHADAVLRMAEDVVSVDSDMRLAVLCESRDAPRLRAAVRTGSTQVLTLDGEPVARDSSPAPKGAIRLSALSNAYVRLRNAVAGRSPLGAAVVKAIELNSLACLAREIRVRRRYRAWIDAARRLLDRVEPAVVLAWGDRHFDLELPALVAAHQRGTRIVLPYVASSSSDVVLWSRRRFREPRRWTPPSLYRLIANLRLPAAMIREGYFFQEPHVLLALRPLGALPANPWTLGGGLSDVVCADSGLSLAKYREEGVAEEKLHLIGAPEFDVLHAGLVSRAALRNRLAQRYGRDPGKGLVVVALPQFAEQGVMSWDQHWKELRHVLTQIARTGRSVLVSLHPRVEFESYRFLENEFDLRLSTEPLKQILPAADAFVAVNSSTVVWAVLCGIKPLVLDFYGLESSHFGSLRSIRMLHNRETLYADLMAGLAAEVDFSSDWSLLARKQVFDGAVMDRYRRLIRKMAGVPLRLPQLQTAVS